MSNTQIHEAQSLDGLLRRAAAGAPRRTALRFGARAMSYAELDAAADGFAAALSGLRSGATVGVAAALHPAFPIAYFGAMRAGHVCAVVDPLLAEDELDHVLGLAGVEILVATAGMAGSLRRIRVGLPGLAGVVYLDRPGDQGAQTVASLASAAGSGGLVGLADGGRQPRRWRSDPDSVACLRFTRGATGRPRSVSLTHRNLVRGAAQAARAFGFGPSSAVVNHLPAYEPVYLNAAVHAAATQVLCADPDPAAAAALAGREAATHYCGQPVRLARLAADPRPTNWRMPTVRAVLSGGSALTPAAAARLCERLGAPVVQWYGLAEAPLTHCDRLDSRTAGSVGPPVPGTDCRVVDLGGRHPLPPGQPGEVQVRGPQVAAGATDPDGWLGTGDVGYVDGEGVLFLVDRLTDVFTCDGHLVSPTGIERVLAHHPAVADCVVVDVPDSRLGAVGYAYVVTTEVDVEPAEFTAYVNSRLPDHRHLRGIELVGAIPRSADGGVRRCDLRAEARGLSTLTSGATR